MSEAKQRRPPRAHYFARGEGTSFNISNFVEDLIESVFGFALRYAYTTWILIASPRAIAFHILTRNRALRITRPYSFFFFSYLLFLAGFTLSMAFEARMAHLLNDYYGAGFSFKDFMANFSVERLLITLAPTVVVVLICIWVSAFATALVLLPLRRLRALMAPLFFSLAFLISLLFLSLALACAVEVVADEFFGFRSVRSIYTTGLELPAFVILLFSIAISITLARHLSAFLRIVWGRRKKRLQRLARTTVAWCVATGGLYGTVLLAGAIPWVIGDVSARLDVETLETPEPRLACRSAEDVETVYSGGERAARIAPDRGREAPPLLHREFGFLLVNESEAEIELTSGVDLRGNAVFCAQREGVLDCDITDERDIGKGRIVEPRPLGGYVIVAPNSTLGVKVKVTSIEGGPDFVSVPKFELRDQRRKLSERYPGNDCDPFGVSARLRHFRNQFP